MAKREIIVGNQRVDTAHCTWCTDVAVCAACAGKAAALRAHALPDAATANAAQQARAAVATMATMVALPDGDAAPACTLCDGPLVLLGALGQLVYYRCRNCGAESSEDAPPPVDTSCQDCHGRYGKRCGCGGAL